MNDEKTMYDVADLIRRWNISRVTAYQLVNSEGFPTIRIGRRILIPRKQLEAWIEANMKGLVVQ